MKIISLAVFLAFCIAGCNAKNPSENENSPNSGAVTQATTTDKSACDGVAMSEDAASCFDGGWTPTGTCCFATNGLALERFTKGGSAKCCGACFVP